LLLAAALHALDDELDIGHTGLLDGHAGLQIREARKIRRDRTIHKARRK
jgi:hypothetical protein